MIVPFEEGMAEDDPFVAGVDVTDEEADEVALLAALLLPLDPVLLLLLLFAP